MIHQILVIDPAGPCIIDRTYGDQDLDPILISGFLAAVYPRRKELGFDLEKINQELNKKSDNSYFEAIIKNDWIIAGFVSNNIYQADFISILNDVGNIAYKQLGNPVGYGMISNPDMNTIVLAIDNLINKKGIKVANKTIKEDKVSQILINVYNKSEMPADAVIKILDGINNGNFDEEGLKNIVKTIQGLLKKSKAVKNKIKL